MPWPRRLRYGVVATVAVVAVALLVTGVVLMTTRTRPRERTVPSSIPADCSRPVDNELNAFLATVADGSTVNFQPGKCYAQIGPVTLKGRKHLTIDGRGATLRSWAPNDNSKFVPQWAVIRSQNLALHDFRIVGNFDDPGPPNAARASVTTNAGVAVEGSTGIALTDLTILNVFGDGVLLENSAHHDTEPAEYPKDVRVTRLRVDRAARHCFGVSQGTGLWLQDSTLNNCYLDGIDIEKDVVDEPIGDIHIVNNRISNYFAIGVVVAIGGPRENPVRGITIRGNHFPTLALATVCDQPIVVGIYPNQYFSDIQIENNQMVSWRVAIEVVRVLDGSIRNNRITHPPEARPNNCEPEHEDNVVRNDSPNLAVSHNG